jgi:hypothetical protein
MSVAVVTNITPSHIDVAIGQRSLRVDGEANIENPQAPYFVFSNSIRTRDLPHGHEPISDDERTLVLSAIREYLESKGMKYIVDPTDEEYRSC